MKALLEALESQEFYEVMQTYRHADFKQAGRAFEGVKEWLQRKVKEAEPQIEEGSS